MFKISIKEITWILLSAFLTALAVRFFFIEYALTPGGITGLSITLSSLLNLSVDVISLSISIPALIISFFLLGNKFALKTIVITIAIPLFLRIIPQTHVVNNILIASILGGILVGISIAIAIHSQCATGGTDTIAYLVQKICKQWELSKIIFVIDMTIVLSSYIISKQYYTAIFSTISLISIVLTIKLFTYNLLTQKAR